MKNAPDTNTPEMAATIRITVSLEESDNPTAIQLATAKTMEPSSTMLVRQIRVNSGNTSPPTIAPAEYQAIASTPTETGLPACVMIVVSQLVKKLTATHTPMKVAQSSDVPTARPSVKRSLRRLFRSRSFR